MPINLAFSTKFIAEAKLPPKPHANLSLAAEPTVFDTIKNQAIVVGSDVVSFESGVDDEFRRAIADSALLAQFVASATTPPTQDPIGWFDAYFAALANFGWVTQSRDTAVYDTKGEGLDVHQAILQVVAAFAGAAPAAVALITTALNALHSMNQDSPLITLFNKESQHGTVGSFQITAVRKDPTKGLLAEAIAFALTADSTITQILFFKLQKSRTTLRRSQGSVSLDVDAMRAVAPAIKTRIAAYRLAYIAAIPLPPVPPT